MASYNFTQTYLELQDIVDRADKFYPVVYGTTTYAEVASAVTVGQTPICTYSGKVFTYQKTESNKHVFTALDTDGEITIATLTSSDVWANSTNNPINSAVEGMVYQDSNGLLYVND